MSLTKQTLIDSVMRQCELNKSEATQTLEALLEIIKKTLASGQDVLASGFGKFCVKEKRARKGRNPQTGEDLMLRPRRVVTFQCSSVLKDAMNGKGQRWR